MARRFAPTCARRAWGRLVGAQEPAHSEPSARIPVNHKTSHFTGGKTNGTNPNDRKARYPLRAAAVDGPHPAKYMGRGKYPTRWWAEPSLSRDRRIERAQYGARDRGGALAAAEFAGLEARRRGAVDRGLNGRRRLVGAAAARAGGRAAGHQAGGRDHGGGALRGTR